MRHLEQECGIDARRKSDSNTAKILQDLLALLGFKFLLSAMNPDTSETQSMGGKHQITHDQTAIVDIGGNALVRQRDLAAARVGLPVIVQPVGAQLSEKYGVEYLAGNYKKKDGYNRSIELSKAYGLYRQHYCGCEFSERDARKAMEKKAAEVRG